MVPFTSANGYSRHITLPSTLEGFFGRLKVEMFYGEKWSGWSVADFMDKINAYIYWYNETRVKRSLGGLSPVAYRRKLGFVA